MRLLSLLLSLFLIGGCTQTTTGIWKNPEYKETISHFLMTMDNEKIIFIGKKHHYIFLNNTSLNDAINMNNIVKFNVHFNNNFYLTLDNEISGVYEISCKCNAVSNSIKMWLTDNGFIKKEINNSFIYTKTSKIDGKRYSSNNLAFDDYEKIDKDYKITVETEKSSLGIAGRAALTPIAVAEDGVATIGTAGLLVIAAPFVAGHYIVNGESP